MKAILHLVKFELKQRLLSWISVIFFLMLLFQAIWYTKGTFDYYVNDGVLMNAPAILYQNYAGMGMLMVIIIAIATGGVLYKDLQHKTADWLYTYPINEKQFFIGRSLSAFLYLFIIGLGVTVGNFLAPYSGIAPPHRFGSAPVVEMLHAILVFQIPNLLLFVAIIFASVTYTKKMTVGYLAAFLMTIMFLLMQVSYESSGGGLGYAYADPFGFVAVEYYYDHVATFEKNNGVMNISGYVLANRLIWLSATAIIFVLGYRKFSFKHFISKSSKTKTINAPKSKIALAKVVSLPTVRLSFFQKDFVKKLMSLSKLEFLNIVRPVSFKIIVAILMFMVFMQNVLFNANYYIGAEVPLTSNMTYFRLPWGVFIVMLLMIWSGELFFKEKTVKIWQITDALPVPVWVTQLSKFIASCGLAFVLCVSFVVIGLVSQTLLGGASLIDFKQYIIDVFGYRWGFINFVFEIALVFFIAGLTGNRFLTHILSVGIFLYLIISFDMGLMEQVRYGFALTPGVEDFSEMSGYGILLPSANWFALLWGMLSAAFIMLGILFWRRGSQGKWFKKIVGNQLSLTSKIALVVTLAGFFVLQSFIDRNIYSNGNFTLKSVQEQEDADYENTYGYLKNRTLPKYKGLQLNMDYYPEARKVDYHARIELSSAPKDTLFLSFKDNVVLKDIQFNKSPLTKVHHDSIHHVFGYLIDATGKNDSIPNYLRVEAVKQYEGLSQSDLQTDITENGSYASVKEFLPTIGYDSDRELDENRSREDNGLEKLTSRMAETDNVIALNQYATTEDALKVRGELILSTSKNQTVLAPGILVHKEEKANRNYFTYKINTPTTFNWYVGSANYKQFLNSSYKNTPYAIYAKPEHNFNIDIYKDAIEKSLDYFKPVLQDLNFGNISLYEKHYWSDTDYDAFANTIVISEKHGWVADTSKMAEKSYVYQTVASQIAKLWIHDNFNIANVQGANMLGIAIPEALALKFVEKTLGKEALEHLLKKKRDKYAKDRNNEPNTEPPLLYADGIDYLEANKGAIAIFNLINVIGEDTLMQVLTKHQKTDDFMVFKDVYNDLLTKIPNAKKEEVREWFEVVL